MPLKYLKFELIESLTEADIMKIVKLTINNELLISIEKCSQISEYTTETPADYIGQNS